MDPARSRRDRPRQLAVDGEAGRATHLPALSVGEAAQVGCNRCYRTRDNRRSDRLGIDAQRPLLHGSLLAVRVLTEAFPSNLPKVIREQVTTMRRLSVHLAVSLAEWTIEQPAHSMSEEREDATR